MKARMFTLIAIAILGPLLALTVAGLQLAAGAAVPGTGAGAFTDVSAMAGVTATHAACQHSPIREIVYVYPVTGQAWGDYDQDGWVDLYLTDQCGPNVLYRNHGDGTFRVSPLSDAVSPRGVMSGGAIFADYDNDGWPDLYVLTFDGGILYHNDRGRSFTDVTARAGVEHEGHGMTASWADYDRDGYLDLYVANYGCTTCPNRPGEGAQGRLFRNKGGGSFADVTHLLPAERTFAQSFVGGWVDYDNDGDPDLYVVNDVRGTRFLPGNALIRNDGPGCEGWCFADVTELSGAGVRADGMGLAVGDYDGDGHLDLYFTNTGWAFTPLTGPSVLLRNGGDGTFRETAGEAGAAVDAIGWGTVFLDYDSDGWSDLYVAVGFDLKRLGILQTTNRLLRNRGNGTFNDETVLSGAADTGNTLGVATADYNRDGWPDLVIGNINSGYRLYANTGTAGRGNHRLMVQLRGGGPVNRDAVGARVYLTTDDGRTQLREVMAGSSLGAGNDLAMHFGLGRGAARSLRVVWPDGKEQSFVDVPSDALWQLTYGGEPTTTALREPDVPTSLIVLPQLGGARPGGLTVPILTVVATAALAAYAVAKWTGRAYLAGTLAAGLLLGGVGFQVVHYAEHLFQADFWLGHHLREPFITPWGWIATDGWTAIAGNRGARATGTELLHLTGNWIFLAGLIPMFFEQRTRRAAIQIAFWGEFIHVIEHVSLTATWFLFRLPIGSSTLFGLAYQLPEPWPVAIRIWWHFAMNFAMTGAALVAVWAAWRTGLLNPVAASVENAGTAKRSAPAAALAPNRAGV